LNGSKYSVHVIFWYNLNKCHKSLCFKVKKKARGIDKL